MIKRTSKIIISLFFLTLIKITKPLSEILKQSTEDSFIILFYHSVPDKFIPNFLKQLDYLQKKTIPVSIDFKNPSGNNLRYSIITFDDAFQSALKNAIPELIKRGIPSTIFVPAGCLGKNPEWLKDTEHPDRHETIATIPELQNLNNEYISIGSHSMNHLHLPELTDEKAFYEIHESKIFLENNLKNQIKYLAFPFGEFNNKILELCKASGYEQVFTIDAYSQASSIRYYNRSRIEIEPSDWAIEYRLKITGAYSWMHYASKLKRKIKSVFR